MSANSPVKSNESTTLFAKNIRLNLNSKFIPHDFFPQSISQHYKKARKSQNQSPCLIKRKSSANSQNPQQNQSYEEAINLQIIKKRLIKIKQASQLNNQEQDSKKISFKKRSSSKEGLRKMIQKCKSKDKAEQKQKNKPKGYSKKLMDYMQKMKNVINIDIKIQDDDITPVIQKRTKDSNKQNSSNNQSENSHKFYRRRPKSEINSRERLTSKQKLGKQANQILFKPLKIKVKQVNKIMKESIKQKQISKNKNDRYNKFVDIPLDQDGMLTFYGSPDTKSRHSYDSKKYTIRSSLPKLNK